MMRTERMMLSWMTARQEARSCFQAARAYFKRKSTVGRKINIESTGGGTSRLILFKVVDLPGMAVELGF